MNHTRFALTAIGATLALAALLVGCPGELPGRDFSSANLDRAVGGLGGPCYSGGACNSGLICQNGMCVMPSGGEWNPPADGPNTSKEGAPPQADLPPQTPDLPPPAPDQKITATGGFGDKCNASKTCGSAYICAVLSSGSNGFCTKKCPTQAKACSGGASNTAPVCILKDAKNNLYCVFLCKWKGGNASCPNQLTCSPAANPPGSGQHICMP